MLISRQKQSKLDSIVNNSYLAFAVALVGIEALSEEDQMKAASLGLGFMATKPWMEQLYLVARGKILPSNPNERFNTLVSRMSNVNLPIIDDSSAYTVEHAKAMAVEALENTKFQLKSKVRNEILRANAEARELRAVHGLVESDARRDLVNRITALVAGGAIAALFAKEIISTITNTVNSSVVDELKLKAAMSGKNTSDVLVFKQVVWDNRLSAECRKLHTNPDGSPKIYTMAELEANGTNVGKPKSQWKAVIGGTHPNCRCALKQATEDILSKK
jgi:hypothetical protein